MSSLFTAPTLQYVGSCDTSTAHAHYGSVMFTIIFDSSINLLMFEYLVKTTSSDTAPITIVSTGFLHTDTCIQSGITNQYLIPIPAHQNSTDTDYVQVRAYDSTTGQATPWSLPLEMNYPPVQPTILSAYYDNFTYYGSDDILYVLFSSIDTSNVIVAYYYTNNSTQQVTWEVTPPSPVLEFTYAGSIIKYIEIPLLNDVDLGSPIYVAVHSVYSWSDASGNYSAVSEVTPTVTAENAIYAPPTLDTLDYLVYTPSQEQTMSLAWSPPIPSINPLQIMVVDYYNLYIYRNSILIETVDVGNVTTYDVNVSSYDCGSEMSFKVSAVSTSGVETSLSNSLSENIFRYSSQPLALNVGYIFNVDSTSIDLVYEFRNPSSVGCGSPVNFKCVITTPDASSNPILVSEEYRTYVSGTQPYVISNNNLSVPAGAQEFTISVSLGTNDTNSNEVLYGATNSITRIIMNVPVITNIDLYGSTLSFLVTTPTLLDLVNNVVMLGGAGFPLVVDWSSNINGPYVVSFTTDAQGIYIYTVEIDLGSNIPDVVIVNSSNAEGIGHTLANV